VPARSHASSEVDVFPNMSQKRWDSLFQRAPALRSAEARGGGRERQQSGGLAVRVAAIRRAWRRCPRAAAICRGLGNRLCATARRRRRRWRRPRAAAGHRPCRLLRAARRRLRRRRQLIVAEPGTRPAAGRENGGKDADLVLQPFSLKSRTPTVVKEFQIGLYDPAEADLELCCNSWSAGFLGERL